MIFSINEFPIMVLKEIDCFTVQGLKYVLLESSISLIDYFF